MLLHISNPELIQKLRDARQAVTDAYVIFNNDEGTNAVEDALEQLQTVEDEFWSQLTIAPAGVLMKSDIAYNEAGEAVVL